MFLFVLMVLALVLIPIYAFSNINELDATWAECEEELRDALRSREYPFKYVDIQSLLPICYVHGYVEAHFSFIVPTRIASKKADKFVNHFFDEPYGVLYYPKSNLYKPSRYLNVAASTPTGNKYWNDGHAAAMEKLTKF